VKPTKGVLLVLGLAALIAGSCGRSSPPETSAPAQQQQQAAGGSITVGGDLNASFPKVDAPYTLTFTQEKAGYAQADLSRDGEKLAQLSVSDTNANPSARDKFASSSRSFAGHPSASVGSQGTAILVNGRYQIQVRSQSASFSAQDREAWLARFQTSSLR
jgi:hypothetical protein